MSWDQFLLQTILKTITVRLILLSSCLLLKKSIEATILNFVINWFAHALYCLQDAICNLRKFNLLSLLLLLTDHKQEPKVIKWLNWPLLENAFFQRNKLLPSAYISYNPCLWHKHPNRSHRRIFYRFSFDSFISRPISSGPRESHFKVGTDWAINSSIFRT